MQQSNIQHFTLKLKSAILALFILIMTSFSATAEQTTENNHEDKGFNAGEVIMHHVMDNHEIHIGPLHIPLTIILYSKEKGFDFFM